MCGLSSPALAATGSSKLRHLRDPLSAVWLDLVCLPHVIMSKFGDHLPLYRQSEIYARQDVEISRSTMAGLGLARQASFSARWSTRSRSMCSPDPSCMPMTHLSACCLPGTARRRPVASGLTSETIGRLASTHRQQSGSHTRKIARASILANTTTPSEVALQADAYAGFQHLYGKDIYEAACWAHARRKFHEIHIVHASPTTTETLARIGALYATKKRFAASQQISD